MCGITCRTGVCHNHTIENEAQLSFSFLIFHVQAQLQDFLGRKDLDKHLDADEAIVLGAALHAANLSDGIKLNRKLGMIDGSSYGIVIEIHVPDLVKGENTRRMQIVQRMKKLPSRVI